MARPLILFALVIFSLTAQVGAQDRFPALKRIEPAAAKRLAEILDWQRTYREMTQEDLVAKLGAPDGIEQLAPNAASNKPMQSLIYRLSRRSTLRFTIHDGRVAAISVTLVPSANEEGPVD